MVLKENPGLSNEAAVGKCEGMFNSGWKKKKAKGSCEEPVFEEDFLEIGPFVITPA